LFYSKFIAVAMHFGIDIIYIDLSLNHLI